MEVCAGKHDLARTFEPRLDQRGGLEKRGGVEAYKRGIARG
jgi:hypothetical protein